MDEWDRMFADVRQRSDEARLEAAMLREELRVQQELIRQACEALRRQNSSLGLTLAQAKAAKASLPSAGFRMCKPSA